MNGTAEMIRKKRASIFYKHFVTLSTIFYIVTEALEIQVSRRMANLSFAVWVCWVGIQFLGGFFIIEYYLMKSDYNSILFQSINRNQLAIFLIANLMTGCINLSLDTLSFSDIPAFMIITVYVLVTSIVAVTLNKMNITLRL
jgi:phosphatidylinositol glycan class W